MDRVRRLIDRAGEELLAANRMLDKGDDLTSLTIAFTSLSLAVQFASKAKAEVGNEAALRLVSGRN